MFHMTLLGVSGGEPTQTGCVIHLSDAIASSLEYLLFSLIVASIYGDLQSLEAEAYGALRFVLVKW